MTYPNNIIDVLCCYNDSVKYSRVCINVSTRNIHIITAACFAFSKARPVHWVILSLHCSLGLPLQRLPSIMPSSRSLCRESCRMTCLKMTAFSSLPFQTATFWYLRYESRPRSGCVLSSLFSVCASGSTFSNASRRCCDILLMVHVSTPYSNVDKT